MLLLDNATSIVECNTRVLLCAWIIGHRHHALLVLKDRRIRAASTRVLFLCGELLLLNRGECHFRAHVQEGSQLSANRHLCRCGKDAKNKGQGLHVSFPCTERDG